MKDERARLEQWKNNILDATKFLEENNYVSCAFNLGFMAQALKFAISEFEEEKK